MSAEILELSFDGPPGRTPAQKTRVAHEYKIISMRECPLPETLELCDTPDRCAAYWRTHIKNHPAFNPEVESFFVLLLNTRRRVKGHVLISTGTMDTLLAHPREVFRAAIIGSAHAVVLFHNHPSGDPSPSEADITVTRKLFQAGLLLQMEILDHVIIGAGETFSSLRTLGYFYS